MEKLLLKKIIYFYEIFSKKFYSILTKYYLMLSTYLIIKIVTLLTMVKLFNKFTLIKIKYINILKNLCFIEKKIEHSSLSIIFFSLLFIFKIYVIIEEKDYKTYY